MKTYDHNTKDGSKNKYEIDNIAGPSGNTMELEVMIPKYEKESTDVCRNLRISWVILLIGNIKKIQ